MASRSGLDFLTVMPSPNIHPNGNMGWRGQKFIYGHSPQIAKSNDEPMVVYPCKFPQVIGWTLSIQMDEPILIVMMMDINNHGSSY
jgi:hypothetical protein